MAVLFSGNVFTGRCLVHWSKIEYTRYTIEHMFGFTIDIRKTLASLREFGEELWRRALLLFLYEVIFCCFIQD